MPIEPAHRLITGNYPPPGRYDADIIILTMNRFAETLEAVASAQAQSGGSFHIMVLDQGSAPHIQDGFAAAFAGLPHFGYVVSGANLGVGGGRNLLSSFGHGDVIVALDNDACFATNTVAAEAVAAFAAQPDLGALAFRIFGRDGASLDHLAWGYPLGLKPRAAERFDTTTFVGAGHAIRRLTWEQAGGYDPSLFFTWEEYDFCLAAIACGWVIRYDGALGVVHKVAAEARLAWTAERLTLSIRNRLVIARKWGISWLRLAPRIIGYLIKGWRNGCLLPTLHGVVAALRNKTMLPQRMPEPMRAYLYRNETRHRGALLHRLRAEVLRKINYDS